MKINFAFNVVLFLTLFGCSRSDFATVTLVTGLENRSPVKNLMMSLGAVPHQKVLALGADGNCLQKNLFAGIKTGNADDDSDVNTFPINMVMPYDPSAPTEIDSGWLADNANFPPIQMTVPRGSTVKFGVIGSIISSTSAESDGTCSPLKPSSLEVNPTYSIAGHLQAYVNSSVEIPINVWVINSNTPPTPTSGAGVDCTSNPGNDDALSQICPSRDYLSASCEGCQGPVRFEYGFGRNRADHVTQMISLDEMSLYPGVSIPRMGNMVVTLKDVDGVTDIGSTTVLKSSFDSAGIATLAIDLTTGGTATLTVVDGAMIAMPTPEPTASPEPPAPPTFALADIHDLNGMTTIQWEPIPNGLASFKIQYHDSNSDTFDNIVGPIPATEPGQLGFSFYPNPVSGFAPYYYQVIAVDLLGNEMTSSNVLNLMPVGPITSFTATSGTYPVLSWEGVSSAMSLSITLENTDNMGVFDIGASDGTVAPGCSLINPSMTFCNTVHVTPPPTYQLNAESTFNGSAIARTVPFFAMAAIKNSLNTNFTFEIQNSGLLPGISYKYYLESKSSPGGTWNNLSDTGVSFTLQSGNYDLGSASIVNSDVTPGTPMEYRA